MYAIRSYYVIWRNGGWFGLYEMVPGFGLATLTIWLVSLLDKAPSVTVTQGFRRMELTMAANGELDPGTAEQA